MLQVEDEKKIIYDYEYVWDEYGIVRRLDVQQIELSSSTLTLLGIDSPVRAVVFKLDLP